MSGQIDIKTKLEDLICPNSRSVWKMGERMRVRPELIFRILSDAFDTALKQKTLRKDEGEIRFETDFAEIELIPTGEPHEPRMHTMIFKPKEAMLTVPVTAHPKEVFSVPDRMENNIGISNVSLNLIEELLGSKKNWPTQNILETLVSSYRKAWEDGTLQYDGEKIIFDTTLEAENGSIIQCIAEPKLYAPIPNTWTITDAVLGGKL